MEVSYQCFSAVALSPDKEPSHISKRRDWAPEQVWKFWRREKSFDLAKSRTKRTML
jgi:hypothetical protein